MRTPRPLEIPRQVGIAFCLHALLLDISDPLLAGHEAIKGIRLKDAEGNQGSESTYYQGGNDQYPILIYYWKLTVDRYSILALDISCGKRSSNLFWFIYSQSFTIANEVTYNKRTQQQNCQRIDIDLRCQRHPVSQAEAEAEQEQTISE